MNCFNCIMCTELKLSFVNYIEHPPDYRLFGIIIEAHFNPDIYFDELSMQLNVHEQHHARACTGAKGGRESEKLK